MDIGTVRSAVSRARARARVNTRVFACCSRSAHREPGLSYNSAGSFWKSLRRNAASERVRRHVREHAKRYREARRDAIINTRSIGRERSIGNREFDRPILHRD